MIVSSKFTVSVNMLSLYSLRLMSRCFAMCQCSPYGGYQMFVCSLRYVWALNVNRIKLSVKSVAIFVLVEQNVINK